jgi:hypothetical protein
VREQHSVGAEERHAARLQMKSCSEGRGPGQLQQWGVLSSRSGNASTALVQARYTRGRLVSLGVCN